MTTTTVINTVETESVATIYNGGSLLVTGTGGYIDTTGDGLEFNSTSAEPIGTVTVDAGGLVFGNGNGIDFTAFNGNGDFVIDGSVQGNNYGMALSDSGTDTGNVTITIGSQGSVSGGEDYGIQTALSSASTLFLVNHGSIINGLLASGGQVDITNTGTIDGVTVEGTSNPNYIDNLGTIDGTLYAAPDTDIQNTGYITSIIPDFGQPSVSDVTVYNTGTIGSVNLGNNATVYDNGIIEGLISAGSESNVVIGAQGSIEAGTVTAISAGTGSTVKNAGFVDGATGIMADATTDDITLTNTGTVIGGVNFSGSQNDIITNSGTIHGGIALGFGDAVTNTSTISGGITGEGSADIVNTGTIAGGISDSLDGDTIDNSGKIMSGINVKNAFVTNSGTIHGGISFTNTSVLDNTGLIVGPVTFSGPGDILTNAGTIHGAVTLGANDSLTNDGTISASLTLGTGDTLNLDAGTVTGHIFATTSDTFDFAGSFGKYEIAHFATAGTTHDIINFASDDFTSYTELQSHMAQEGTDVVITLDASDDIILLNTKLASLLSHDFTFS